MAKVITIVAIIVFQTMDKNLSKKPHAVCVPFPAQGHIIPMMQLAKLLHSRGFYITFVNTEFNHRRLIRSQGPNWAMGFPDFRFKTITEGLPQSDRDATQDPEALSASVRKNCLGPFRDLLAKLMSDTEDPPVTCVISDGLMSFAIKAAEEIGVTEVQFWTTSACGFMGYLHYPELIKRDIFPFKDESFMNDGSLDQPICWIPGMHSMRIKDMPSFVRTTNPHDILFNFMSDEAQNNLKSSAIILNTFDELEHEVLQAISSISPKIYTLGPLSLLANGIQKNELSSFRPSLWKEDTNCLKWLDQRDPKSVVYVNYGSVTVMSHDHLKEFAWGLANSKHPFLWVVRPDIVMGGDDNDSTKLPEEFLQETKDRGLLTSWCPQDQVISHSSVGVFLTHCGWNSIFESLCYGVPMICWPFFAEQQTNCRYACEEWGIGVEVSGDVKRGEIKCLIKEIMEGDRGQEMKKKAMEWMEKARAASDVGGSSYINFDSFINEALR